MKVVLYTSTTCDNCDSFVQILNHLRGENGYIKKVINTDLEAQLHEIATLEEAPNKACSRRIRTNRAAIIAVGKELAKAQVEAGV